MTLQRLTLQSCITLHNLHIFMSHLRRLCRVICRAPMADSAESLARHASEGGLCRVTFCLLSGFSFYTYMYICIHVYVEFACSVENPLSGLICTLNLHICIYENPLSGFSCIRRVCMCVCRVTFCLLSGFSFYIYVYMYTCIRRVRVLSIHIYIYICIYVYLYICIYVYWGHSIYMLSIHIYISQYTYIHIRAQYTYIHIYKLKAQCTYIHMYKLKIHWASSTDWASARDTYTCIHV